MLNLKLERLQAIVNTLKEASKSVAAALQVATDALNAKPAETPDAPEMETLPEDTERAKTPDKREENNVEGYNDSLWTIDPDDFNKCWEKAFYAMRDAYPNHVHDSQTCIPYEMYLDNFRYYFYHWCLSWRFKNASLFPMILEESRLFDNEEAKDLINIMDELEKELPSLPRLRQMWVRVVRTNKFQSGESNAETLAFYIQTLIKYEEGFKPNTTYWVSGEPDFSYDQKLVTEEARRQAETANDGIGACIMRHKKENAWILTVAAFNKQDNTLIEKTLTLKKGNVYEATIALVNITRLEAKNA